MTKADYNVFIVTSQIINIINIIYIWEYLPCGYVQISLPI